MGDQPFRLAQYSLAVRESTLKRLRLVTEGFQNWGITPESLSVAEIALHLSESDRWLFAKLNNPSLESIKAIANPAKTISFGELGKLLAELDVLGTDRGNFIRSLSEEALNRRVSDSRFDGDVTVWWVIVRGNLDHECHHRGQLSAYLRAIDACRCV